MDKKCISCRKIKPLDQFQKTKGRPGETKVCLTCRQRNNNTATRHYYEGRTSSKDHFTSEDYNLVLASQGGGCAICKKPEPEGRKLCVDHDHITDRIRGLLCTKCNAGLGQFKDNAELLKQAIRYLGATPTLDRFMVTQSLPLASTEIMK